MWKENYVTFLPWVCVRRLWPVLVPVLSVVSIPPGWVHCRWAEWHFSCLWSGWLFLTAGEAPCEETLPYRWPIPDARSHPDQCSNCFWLDLRFTDKQTSLIYIAKILWNYYLTESVKFCQLLLIMTNLHPSLVTHCISLKMAVEFMTPLFAEQDQTDSETKGWFKA